MIVFLDLHPTTYVIGSLIELCLCQLELPKVWLFGSPHVDVTISALDGPKTDCETCSKPSLAKLMLSHNVGWCSKQNPIPSSWIFLSDSALPLFWPLNRARERPKKKARTATCARQCRKTADFAKRLAARFELKIQQPDDATRSTSAAED